MLISRGNCSPASWFGSSGVLVRVTYLNLKGPAQQADSLIADSSYRYGCAGGVLTGNAAEDSHILWLIDTDSARP